MRLAHPAHAKAHAVMLLLASSLPLPGPASHRPVPVAACGPVRGAETADLRVRLRHHVRTAECGLVTGEGQNLFLQFPRNKSGRDKLSRATADLLAVRNKSDITSWQLPRAGKLLRKKPNF